MKHFGSTLTETIRAFRTHLGSGRNVSNPKEDQLHAITRIGISVVVLGAGIFLVVTGESDKSKAGMCLIGIVTGYWLR